MDTSQYKPDELKVNVTQNTLTVEAKHTEQSDDGRSFVSKQFLRRYTLPRDCKYDLVSSNLSADGILVISAPKMTVSSAAQDSGRNVPILRAWMTYFVDWPLTSVFDCEYFVVVTMLEMPNSLEKLEINLYIIYRDFFQGVSYNTSWLAIDKLEQAIGAPSRNTLLPSSFH